ncbi:hypothetical protein GALMADRAFT_137536 [Galerina marginata CBS 339.88]|uniref:Uncharacterized protein n=1 Tax=Galerina marginata (strain CBS 339.88) TaxID=685588 RepID=A0A067THP5_GALM3|nr:hypothetical protein GALMADRAFT_137536 [Galerina marginata CBS 339.88]
MASKQTLSMKLVVVAGGNEEGSFGSSRTATFPPNPEDMSALKLSWSYMKGYQKRAGRISRHRSGILQVQELAAEYITSRSSSSSTTPPDLSPSATSSSLFTATYALTSTLPALACSARGVAHLLRRQAAWTESSIDLWIYLPHDELERYEHDHTAGVLEVFAPYFAEAKKGGLGLTLHIAETIHNPAEGTLNLLFYNPHRLGHATLLSDEAVAIVLE